MIVAPRLQPFLIAIAACVALAAFAAYDLFRERALAVRGARATTANLARLLEEQMRQSMHRVESTLQVGVVRMSRDSRIDLAANSELSRQLRSLLPADGFVQGLELLDEHGVGVVSTSTGGPQLAPGASREWFTLHRDGSGPKLAIGRLERDRSKRWVLPVSMRLAGPDGGFRGVLVALVDMKQVQKTFEALDTGSNGFVTLFLPGGWLVATAPANEALFERNWSNSPLFTEHLPRARTGTVQQVVVRDQTERVYSYRALSDFPVVVSTGISLTDALADWRLRFLWNAILLLATFVILLGAAFALSNHYRRREAAERAMADAVNQIQAIVDNVPDAIITFDAQGRIESCNVAGERIFGYSAGAMRGRDVAAVVPALGARSEVGDPDSQTAAARLVDGRFEATALYSGGYEVPVEVALTSVMRSGLPTKIALVRDTTESKRTQAVLAAARERAEQSERFLRQVTDNVPLRIAYVDKDLRYRFVNEAHCKRFNRPREEILGRTRDELTGAQTLAPVLGQLQQALQGETRRFEFVEDIGGKSIVVESHVVPDIDEDGTVRGFYSASADVTERHQQQQRIEAALAERETLLREVYHRVKNNLQVVQSLLSLQQRALPQGLARAALAESVQRIRAMALVHEKLYQAGSLSAVSLRSYTHDLMSQIADSAGAHARGVSIHTDVVDVQAGLDVSIPYGLLVTELVANSLKHGLPPGRSGEIWVVLSGAGDQLSLRVSDNGNGFPPGFDLGTVRTMGLQLAASLAAQLGGSLRARNSGGAVFTAELPRLG